MCSATGFPLSKTAMGLLLLVIRAGGGGVRLPLHVVICSEQAGDPAVLVYVDLLGRGDFGQAGHGSPPNFDSVGALFF